MVGHGVPAVSASHTYLGMYVTTTELHYSLARSKHPIILCSSPRKELISVLLVVVMCLSTRPVKLESIDPDIVPAPADVVPAPVGAKVTPAAAAGYTFPDRSQNGWCAGTLNVAADIF
jgi:hypothetical protein